MDKNAPNCFPRQHWPFFGGQTLVLFLFSFAFLGTLSFPLFFFWFSGACATLAFCLFVFFLWHWLFFLGHFFSFDFVERGVTVISFDFVERWVTVISFVFVFFFWGVGGIITVNPPEVWPVFILPTRSLKLYTLPTWTSICYPFVTHLWLFR